MKERLPVSFVCLVLFAIFLPTLSFASTGGPDNFGYSFYKGFGLSAKLSLYNNLRKVAVGGTGANPIYMSSANRTNFGSPKSL